MADEITISVRAEDNFSGVLGNFGSIVTGIESAINLAGQAFSFFGDMAMEGLESIANYERLSLSFQSLSASQMMMTGQATNMNAAMAESAIIAEDLLAWNQELAIHSPFTAEGVSEAFRMAMAYGFNVEESQRLTEAMIDFTAATGQSEFAMESIARALGQISATGKLTAQDMNQLTQVGVPALEILAQHFGVTTEEIIKMRADGLIPAQDAIEAITGWMETNFAGAANNFTNSWAGMISTFSDLKEIGLRELFTGMFDALQPLAIQFSSFIQTEGFERFREWGYSLGQITTDLITFAQQIQGMSFSDLTAIFENWTNNIDWNKLSNDIATAINNINWGAVGLEIRAGFINIMNGLGTIVSEIDWNAVLSAVGNAFLDVIGGLFGYMDWDLLAVDFMNGFVYIGQQIDGWFSTQKTNINGWFMELFFGITTSIAELGKSAVDQLSSTLDTIKNSAIALGITILNSITDGLLGTVDLWLSGWKILSDSVSNSSMWEEMARNISQKTHNGLITYKDLWLSGWVTLFESVGILQDAYQVTWLSGWQVLFENSKTALIGYKSLWLSGWTILFDSVSILFDSFKSMWLPGWENLFDGIKSISTVSTSGMAHDILQGLKDGFSVYKDLWLSGWSTLFNNILNVRDFTRDISREILEGLRDGFLTYADIWLAGWRILISNFKILFGISSPSTVFTQFGKDIVQGLINGWSNLFDTFLDLIDSGINAILDLFSPFLALFGIDVGTSSGTGTIGGVSGGSDSTVGGSSGNGVVNNYFYGPVYIGSSLEGANYDCPSPNPLVAASGNQLVATGY